MEGKLEDGRVREARRARFMRMGVAAGLTLALVAVSGNALARNFNGSKKGEKIVGTKGADKIRGKSGNDKLKGRGGKDSINGGKGRDKVTGGKGADRHLGAGGNDTLKAVDNAKDKAINGGGGNDRCIIDSAKELSIVKGCETVINGGPKGEDAKRVTLETATGLVCPSQLPTCELNVTLSGIEDATNVTITGSSEIIGLDGALKLIGTDALLNNGLLNGTYGCIADGHITLTIDQQVIDIPIDCVGGSAA